MLWGAAAISLERRDRYSAFLKACAWGYATKRVERSRLALATDAEAREKLLETRESNLRFNALRACITGARNKPGTVSRKMLAMKPAARWGDWSRLEREPPNHPRVAELLLAAGARLDARDVIGNAPPRSRWSSDGDVARDRRDPRPRGGQRDGAAALDEPPSATRFMPPSWKAGPPHLLEAIHCSRTAPIPRCRWIRACARWRPTWGTTASSYSSTRPRRKAPEAPQGQEGPWGGSAARLLGSNAMCNNAQKT